MRRCGDQRAPGDYVPPSPSKAASGTSRLLKLVTNNNEPSSSSKRNISASAAAVSAAATSSAVRTSGGGVATPAVVKLPSETLALQPPPPPLPINSGQGGRSSLSSHSTPWSSTGGVIGRFGAALYNTAGSVAGHTVGTVGAIVSAGASVLTSGGGDSTKTASASSQSQLVTHGIRNQFSLSDFAVPAPLSPVILEGYVEKWTNYLGAWRLRYFIVEPGILKYSHAASQPVKQSFPLHLCSIKAVENDPLRLNVEHRHNVIFLRLHSHEHRELWVKALIRAKHCFMVAAAATAAQYERKGDDGVATVPAAASRSQTETDIEGRRLEDEEDDRNSSVSSSSDGQQTPCGPVQSLIEHCVASRQQLIQRATDIRRDQSALLSLLPRPREGHSSSKDEVRAVSSNLIQNVNQLLATVNKQISLTETYAMEEASQRRSLEKSLHSMAKRNYLIKQRLKKFARTFQKAKAEPTWSQKLSGLLEELSLLQVAAEGESDDDNGWSDSSGEEASVTAYTDKSTADIVEKGLENQSVECRSHLSQAKDDDDDEFYDADEEVVAASYDSGAGLTLAGSDTLLDESSSCAATAGGLALRNRPTFTTDATDMDTSQAEITTQGTTTVTPSQRQLDHSPSPTPRDVLGHTTERARLTLPKPRADLRVSVWSVVKDCIGKDLTRISMPVYFNEPTSFLQRLAEDFQYASLLDASAAATDPAERLLLATVWTITPNASTVGRTFKPFNPLLGETYELSHRGFRFLAEQVEHHPPTTAYHTTGDSNLYEAFGHLVVNTRFTGRNLEISLPGAAHIILRRRITDSPTPPSSVSHLTSHSNNQTASPSNLKSHSHYEEQFLTYQRANGAINNVIFGKLSLEMYGSVGITNHTTGQVSVVEYLKSGWWRGEPHAVRGIGLDPQGRPVWRLGGCWNHDIWAESLDPVVNESFVTTTPVDDSNLSQMTPRQQYSFEYRRARRKRSSTAKLASPGEGDNAGVGQQHDTPPVASYSGNAAAALGSVVSDSLLRYPYVHPSCVSVQWSSLVPVIGSRRVIWRPDSRPATSPRYYDFTAMTFELNQMFARYDVSKGAAMPRTDSRYRPDQRAWEEGNRTVAEAEKARLEEKQRLARQKAAAAGGEGGGHKPRWFASVRDPTLNYVYSTPVPGPEKASENPKRFTQRMNSTMSAATARTFRATNHYWEVKAANGFANVDLPDIF